MISEKIQMPTLEESPAQEPAPEAVMEPPAENTTPEPPEPKE